MGIETIENTHVVSDREDRDLPLNISVPTGDVIKATFQNDHTIVNLANDIGDWAFNDSVPDPDYEPFDDMAGYEGYADDLLHANSREDMARRKQRIDDELTAKATISEASGLQGVTSGLLTAVTDPISWIPIGGPAYRTYRTGGTILEGAAKTAAVAAIIETGREAYMQETQATRTLEESAANIASVTFLTGILGGAAGGLSPARQAEIAAKIDSDMTIPNSGLSSVGAAQAGTTAEQELIKGLDKTQKVFRKIPDALTNPVYRGSTSESKAVRELTEKMADTSLIKNKNTEFIASATSVENKIKAYDALKLKFYRDFTPQWRAYRKRVKEQKAAGGIPQAERLGSKKDGSLSWREFSEEVTKAGRRNDEHIIPEVAATAKSVRANVYDPLKQRMFDTGLLDEGEIEVKTADSWVRRMWDRDKILADRENFKAINLEWLRRQRNAAQAELDKMRQTLEFDEGDLIDLEDLQIQRNTFRKENFGKLRTDKKAQKTLSDLERKISQVSARLPDKADLDALRKLIRRAEADDLELGDIADQIIDRIAGLPGGRLGYDIRLEPKSKGRGKVGARGSAKARVYNIPDELVEDYLVNDVHAIVESHVRTTAADAELQDTFGGLDFDIIKRQVQEDYQQLIARAGKDADKVKKLEAKKRKDISDLQAMWDKLRGMYAQPDDYAAPQHVAERAFLAWNYARLLGGMTLSAVPDMGRHVMVHGMQRTMGDGLSAMITDFKGWKFAVEDVREAAVGLDMALSTTARARANMDEFTPVSGRVDAVSQTVAQNFGNVTLMNQWNTAQKTFAGVMTQTRMMRAIQDVGAGKTIPTKEIENLASHGIDRDMARRIAKQFATHGEKRQRVLVPNARAWDDVAAANTFRSAVRKQVDEIIVTPGLDRPLWMSRPGWRLVGQFRSFAFGAMQRVTMAGLQQADAAAVSGLMLSIGLGAMVYAAKTLSAGREVSDDPRVWLTEGIDRSGVTGWFFDVNNIIEKATRGTVGINALAGGPPMSRYASRNVIDSIAGPTLGLSQDFFQTTGSVFSGDWKESDTRAIRRLLPYQNVIYLRGLFDQMENGVNQAIGVQQ